MVAEDAKNGRYVIGQKNRVYPGDTVKVLRAKGPVIDTIIDNFEDEEGNMINVANKAAMVFSATSTSPLMYGDMLVLEKKD